MLHRYTLLVLGLIVALAAGPVQGQPQRRRAQDPGPPTGTRDADAEIWPFPAPDPKSWWDDKRPKPPEEVDPLGGRRFRQAAQLAHPDNGIDPSTYRLWGLTPLQWQLVRGRELILEVWTRPTNSVRQTVTRVVVREDGAAFVQARAGLACCEAGISRRVGFDARLPSGSAPQFAALANLPLWSSPRNVKVVEPGAVEGLCVDGSAFDLTLVTARRATTLRRACDLAAVGEAADVLEAVLTAAAGHDPRIDVIFPGGANFALARSAFRELIAGGGRLQADTLAVRP